jgi:hypothetical protein
VDKDNSYKNKIFPNSTLIFKYSLIPCVLSIFIFFEFCTYKEYKPSTYDYILYVLNNFFFVLYIYTFIFLISLHNIYSDMSFNNYIYIRLKNRKQWFYENILFILKSSICFISVLLIFSIIISVLNFSNKNLWTDCSFYLFNNISEVFIFSKPLITIVILYFKNFLYLASFGMIYYFLINYTQKVSVAFVGIMIIFGFNVVINLSHIERVLPFTLFYNALWSAGNINLKNIIFSLLYFLVILVLCFILSYKNFQNKDLNWS